MGRVKARYLEFREPGDPGLPLKHYLAVDPGQKGGMAVVTYDGIPKDWIKMPVGTASIIDWILAASSSYLNLLMVIEKAGVLPKQGIKGAFSYGAHFGLFETVAIMLKMPYHTIHPAIWKKSLSLSSRKLDSINACRKIYPKVDLIPAGCRTPHDGLAESLLIAHWARLKNL